ncbi:hypothetical protein E5288_WYG022266 [Bos mutus]|uniref:IRS-type PTB domain-containing protein n=1 Tax=Bos mutus TaxID=72004 RepID=A0A6B0S3J1_9CETA|nr:hypothetical protein [Bos mutus]
MGSGFAGAQGPDCSCCRLCAEAAKPLEPHEAPGAPRSSLVPRKAPWIPAKPPGALRSPLEPCEAPWCPAKPRGILHTHTRWGTLPLNWISSRPGPVCQEADCLLMLAYKDKSERAKGLRERSSLTLEDICGLEPGLPYEGLAHTLAIVCLSQAVMLGFDSREAMCAWDARIRYALGEVHRFPVIVAPGTKLESGPATLHLCNDILVVARDVPPAVAGQWKLSDLRRYGAVPNGFIFEGGTRCGFWAGVFFLSSTEGDQISFLFDCIVRGISPTKGPFGLRPVLPDPSPGGPALEERVAQEALEALQLEKRLSLLSHSGRPGSGGRDDRSVSSSSSEASHSDVSASSRLTPWPEPSSSSASTSQEGPGLAAAQAPGEATPGTARPAPKPLRPRQLQEPPVAPGSPEAGTARDSGSTAGWPGERRRGPAPEAAAGAGESWEAGAPHAGPPPALFSACPICGGLKAAAATPPGLLVTHTGARGPGRPRGETPTYVNVPTSPCPAERLHYLGLQLPEAGAGVRGAGASRYALIDVAATEAAHRAGAQHAQAREERLPAPEQRPKAAPRPAGGAAWTGVRSGCGGPEAASG